MGDGLNIVPNNTNDLRLGDDEEMRNCLDEEGKEYEEEDDISDSEINQYKEAVHKLLKFRTYKVKGPNGELRCPFCVGVEKQEYHRLLEHSIPVGEGSTESGKQRANHFALAKYLVIDLPCEEKRKKDLRNNEMAEQLREEEENYRGLVEKLKENEVAMSNLEDIYRRSILKEQHCNEELEEVRLELIKKDLRNNEMADKLREAEENYGELVKRLDEKEIALSKTNEDASSTVAKLREVEKMCLELQQNLQSTEDKLSHLKNENCVLRLKTLDESPTTSKFVASLSGGFSDSCRTKSGIEKHQRALRNNQMAEKLREAEENYRELVEIHKKEVALSNSDDLQEVRLDLIKRDLRNNQMAEKLKEVAENYRGLVENFKEKEIALANLEDVHQRLVFKERQSNDDLEEVRTELIKLLSDPLSHRHIDLSFGVKGRMGEIYEKALKDACKKRFPFSDAELKLIELKTSIRQAFGIIVDDKGNPQGVLMRSDKTLQGLEAKLGEEIFNLLFERQKYLSGNYMDPKLWNFGENRKATLKEVICYISSILKTQN